MTEISCCLCGRESYMGFTIRGKDYCYRCGRKKVKALITDEAWLRDAGVSQEVEDCVTELRSQFKLSNNQIAKALREKASELAPRKQVKTINVTDKMIRGYIAKQEKRDGVRSGGCVVASVNTCKGTVSLSDPLQSKNAKREERHGN